MTRIVFIILGYSLFVSFQLSNASAPHVLSCGNCVHMLSVSHGSLFVYIFCFSSSLLYL